MTAPGVDQAALLADLLREVRELREEVRQALAAAEPTPAAALAEIHAAVGDRVFTAAEIVQHAATVGGPLAAVTRGNPRSFGRALQRLEGRNHGGLRISRVGQERAGLLWTVEFLEKPANPLAWPGE